MKTWIKMLFAACALLGFTALGGCFLFEDQGDDDDDTEGGDGTWDIYVYNDVSVEGGWRVPMDVWLDHEFVATVDENDHVAIEGLELGTYTLSACSSADAYWYWSGDEVEFTLDDSGGSSPYITFMGVLEGGPVSYMGNGVESWFLTGAPACM